MKRGIRIDHFLFSPGVAQRLEQCEIDRHPRSDVLNFSHRSYLLFRRTALLASVLGENPKYPIRNTELDERLTPGSRGQRESLELEWHCRQFDFGGIRSGFVIR